MLLDKHYFMLKKMREVAEKLNLSFNIIPVIKIGKNEFYENRIIMNLIKFDVTKDTNIMYNNLNYIEKELNIKLNITEFVIIREILFSYDYDKNIYKIYYQCLKEKNLNTIKKIPVTESRIIESNNIININNTYKKCKIKNTLKKYKFLEKYKDIIPFEKYDYLQEKKKYNKLEAILLKISYAPNWIKIKNNKILLFKIFQYFDLSKKNLSYFLKKYKNHAIEYIGLSNNYINIYLLKI